MYLCAEGVKREIASDSASALNPLKRNFPISEHEPEMLSFYPLISQNKIIFKVNICLNRTLYLNTERLFSLCFLITV